MIKSYKLIVWHALVALFAWRVWVLSGGLKFNSAIGFDINLNVFLWFLLVVASIGLGYIFFSRRIWPISISVIVGGLSMAYLGFTLLNLSVAVIFWLCNVWSHERAISDIQGRIKIDIQRTLVVVLMPVVLGFFIMASFAAYQSNFAEQIKDANQLPRQSEVFIKNIVDKFFGSKLGPEDSRVRKQAVNEIASGTLKEINNFLHPYFRWAPPAVAFGLFIILWGLSWIFVYAASFLAMLVFWILKKTKFVRIEEREVKAEILIV